MALFTRPPPTLPTFGGVPLRVVRHARARTMRLRIDPRDGAVRLTLPPRAAIGPALAWVERQRDWIAAQQAARPAPAPIAPGTVIPYQDGRLTVRWTPDGPRCVRRTGDMLELGGPEALVARRVLRWLAAEARAVLEAETRRYAAAAGVGVAAVAIGDARSRWGSCSAGGAIRYSWRLILVPPAVRQATVAHEVAHRLHMDHGPAFHAAVARLYGRAPTAERAWLRTHGAAVMAWGR